MLRIINMIYHQENYSMSITMVGDVNLSQKTPKDHITF